MLKEETSNESHGRGLLATTAATFGGAAGRVAALAKSVLPHEHGVSERSKVNGRFAKKHKHRLPRKLKKALAKENATQA
jgi:hypothetical protein